MLTLDQRHVLVLNRDWMAIHIWPLTHAIRKLWSTYDDGTPKAKIIDPSRDFMEFSWADWADLKQDDGVDVVQSISRSFLVPKVIKVRHDKPPYERVSFSRRRLYKRDHYCCQYCGCRPGSEELTMDHIIPQSRGGETSWLNCCLACVECNSTKAARTPQEAGMSFHFKKFVPKRPKYSLFKDDATWFKKQYGTDWDHFLSDIYWNVELATNEG